MGSHLSRYFLAQKSFENAPFYGFLCNVGNGLICPSKSVACRCITSRMPRLPQLLHQHRPHPRSSLYYQRWSSCCRTRSAMARRCVTSRMPKLSQLRRQYRPYLWICPYCCSSTRGLCQHCRVPCRPECSCLPQLPLLCLRRIFLGDMKKAKLDGIHYKYSLLSLYQFIQKLCNENTKKL